MDNDRDRRAGPEPDEGFDRLLRAALSSDDATAGSECLDAGALAAWCDGALTPSERSFADAHLARCGRCQSLLAVMARTAPVAAAASGPWSLRQWVMMLAPAAAATTAVALWFAVEPRPSQVAPSPVQHVASRDAETAGGSTPLAPPAPPPASGAPAEPRGNAAESGTGAAADRIGKREQKADEKSIGPASRAPAAGEPQERQMAYAKEALDEEKRKLTDVPARSGTAVAVTASSPAIQTSAASNVNSNVASREASANANAPGTPAGSAANSNAAGVGDRRAESPAPPPPPAAQALPPAAPAQTPPSQAAPTQAPAQAMPAQQRPDQQQSAGSFRSGTQSAGGGAGRGAGASQDLQRMALNESIALLPVRLVVASPDAAVQWRVVGDGIVQQSIDKGTTWATQYTLGPNEAIAAGSAPSPTAAWLVGRAGLVLTTSDGRTWRRVVVPAPVDLTAVAAIDARTAIVTAADRRVFSTSDGGRTWRIK